MDASTITTSGIKTRILIISDTHGASSLPGSQPLPPVDVAIHCGDLTEESKLVEFQNTMILMKSIDAPLKIVIAGNHDWTLDTPIFKSKIAEIPPPVDMALARTACTLPNGARLTPYASSFTPSTEDWAFQYDPREEASRQWDVGDDVDVVVTHGPPHGVLDRTAGGERIGSAGLFAAPRRAKPRLHCFGHAHRGWGAKLVRWRRIEGAALADGLAAGEGQGPGPAAASHFADIEHEKSVAGESLAGLTPGRFDGVDVIAEKRRKMEEGLRRGYFPTSHCAGDERLLIPGEDTLFVNAAIKLGDGEQPQHLPWIVDIELPKAP
ncbi:metallophosphoesterase domain-containing protein 2 [Colletotrichum kahawae]|uniref:Metallophosphoesterase domain-containing protein 2 n=1 Tax=Colletotrichum kahawae TaxID=34407 RepID=A0AAE0D566_COLKA|nr:metallophosphoesterase domain-containing protein 2 [Colletotrichum kahawae]